MDSWCFKPNHAHLYYQELTCTLVCRYLYLRWGMDLSKVVVFVGESGDTDYEGLLGGIHKSLVLKGVCSSANNQLHANRSYPLTDVIALDSPNIVRTTEVCSSADLRGSLDELGVLKGWKYQLNCTMWVQPKIKSLNYLKYVPSVALWKLYIISRLIWNPCEWHYSCSFWRKRNTD